ncbi:type I-B CRISPR-associated protein Cas8b/Csh1 [Haloglomus salinum]|uniref:type I-B CRISPR-associated protein Cas8b/Csh1 n=1 Tax=Haloglomus salinum TaxID=2962673 RepID=UPI0020C9C388|nr:type I-B CRISPR-associated protein Cas8b/Csh1 [Haloglomus salinum]
MSDVDVEAFEQAIGDFWEHGRAPVELPDIMAMYGVLAVGASDDGLFRTGSTLDDYLDGEYVTVRIDLTDDDPASSWDVTVDTLTKDIVEALAVSKNPAGKGRDYSITQIGSKTGNSPDSFANTYVSRLGDWCGYDSVRSVFESDDGHPDGWVVEAVTDVLGDDETLDEIADVTEELLAGTAERVVTVAVRLDTSDLEDYDGPDGVQWLYPDGLPVMNEAMRRYAGENMADKNIGGSRISRGPGVDAVNGSEDTLVGTPQSPFGLFSVKHPDNQPSLDRTQSWRNYPVSAETAMLFKKAEDLLEKTVMRRGGMEVYALPYFTGELTPEKASALYRAIQSLDVEQNKKEPPMGVVTYDLEEYAPELAEQELRYYLLTMPIGDDKHVVAESNAVTMYHARQLADALLATLAGPSFAPARSNFGAPTNWPLLEIDTEGPGETARRRRATKDILLGAFIDAGFQRRDTDKVGDDFRRVADHRLLAGEPLRAETLFEEYMQRFSDEFDGTDPVPSQLAGMQLAQLESLSRAGLVDGIPPVEPAPTTEWTTMTEQSEPTDIDTIRERRLESFLDRPLLQEDPERRGAFLAGVLVGQVSWYQENERNVGRPLDIRTPADEITARGLSQAVRTALEKAKIYAAEDDYSSDILYPEVVDRLLDALEADPEDWTLSKRDLQFAYSLGQAFGRRAMPVAFEIRGQNTSTESEVTADAAD